MKPSGIEKEKDKNKQKTAVAISYDPSDDAPKILASGKGILAERIIEKAEEAGVPLHQDGTLSETLSKLEIGDSIPPELYEVVAEVLLFVDKLDSLKSRIAKDEL